MAEKILILYIPVIHRGYLDFLQRMKKKVSRVYLIDQELQEELSEVKTDIAALETEEVKKILNLFGFSGISILSRSNLNEIRERDVILVQCEICRNLCQLYLNKEKIEWESAFLRWDKEKVLADLPKEDISVSKDEFDLKMIEEAYEEAKKSGDWWRQIGAVLVKEGKIIARSYNQGVPDDNSPYQLGSQRDLFKAGEKQEYSPTIHAEQKMIAEAAKVGLKIDDASLYLTHFPCPLCAKIIAWAGIKNLYFREGASNLDGKRTLELAGVKIIHIANI